MDDGDEVDMHSGGTLLHRGDPILQTQPKCNARGLNRAEQASRRFERADLRAEFHQGLIRQPRLGCLHQARGGIPQMLGIILGPSVDAREHTADITVDNGIRFIEGDAQDGPGHILPDARKLDQYIVIRWDFAAMVGRHQARGFY